MTPKTKTDPAVELERLEEVAAKARQEAGELAERARTQQAQRQQLDVGLAQLAREDPSQFGDDGLPMPGSDAAKLKTSLEKLGQSRLSGVAEGAQERVRPAEEAVARHVEAHADLLARKENEGPGKAAVGKIQRGLYGAGGCCRVRRSGGEADRHCQPRLTVSMVRTSGSMTASSGCPRSRLRWPTSYHRGAGV